MSSGLNVFPENVWVGGAAKKQAGVRVIAPVVVAAEIAFPATLIII